MAADKPLVRVILGPTAVGKTDVAIQEAKKIGGVVVSADSRQIYAGMNIGTAKPEEAWRDEAHDVLEADSIDGVPHYLLNVATPDKPWTLAMWQEAAYAVMADVAAKNIPIYVVGGTMLYIDSLLFHFDIPAVAPQPELRERLEKESTDALYTRLLLADPAAQKFIEPHHKQRIIRALEVIEISGKLFSVSRLKREPLYDFEIRGLFPTDVTDEKGWEVLKGRISQRVISMIDGALGEETQKLQQTYSPTLPMLRTMNYAQMAKLLAGAVSREEAIQEMISANMRYARRQMSWWRGRKDLAWQIV